MKRMKPQLTIFLFVSILLSGCISFGNVTEKDLAIADQLRKRKQRTLDPDEQKSIQDTIDWHETKSVGLLNFHHIDTTAKQKPDLPYIEQEEKTAHYNKLIDEQFEKMRKQEETNNE